MIATDIGRAVALLLTAVTILAGTISIAILCLVALVVGSLSVFFSVAYTSYVATLLEADRLVAGNQRLELSDSAAQVVGPTIGGMILAVFGGAAATALDGISYLVSAVAVAAARPDTPTEPVRPPSGSGSSTASARGSGGSPATGSCATWPAPRR